MEIHRDWPFWMERALAQARIAEDLGEVPVGAVLINQEGDLLAEGHNAPITEHDPTAHAEVMTLRQACQRVGNYRLSGTILVCTLEPCLMCLGALVQARIAGIVFGARDAKAGALVSQACFPADFPWLNHTFWHKEGICREQCQDILRQFFVQRRQSKRRGSEVRS